MWTINRDVSKQPWLRLIVLPAFLVLGGSLSACSKETGVVETTSSPDGQHIVQLVREDNAGPGQHSGRTIVRLKRSNVDHYTDVAVFNDDNVNRPLTRVAWLDPRHLKITFGRTNVGFQAIKAGIVEIRYEEMS